MPGHYYEVVVMWPWLRTKLIHFKTSYGRGRSWGGDSIIAGLVGGMVATNSIAAAGMIVLSSVFIFTFVGHAERHWLRTWQEESRQMQELNPQVMQMYHDVAFIRSCMEKRNDGKKGKLRKDGLAVCAL